MLDATDQTYSEILPQSRTLGGRAADKQGSARNGRAPAGFSKPGQTGVQLVRGDHKPTPHRVERGVMPLLFNHEPSSHLGRVETARTDGRKLHVKARFGSGRLAQEKIRRLPQDAAPFPDGVAGQSARHSGWINQDVGQFR